MKKEEKEKEIMCFKRPFLKKLWFSGLEYYLRFTVDEHFKAACKLVRR